MKLKFKEVEKELPTKDMIVLAVITGCDTFGDMFSWCEVLEWNNKRKVFLSWDNKRKVFLSISGEYDPSNVKMSHDRVLKWAELPDQLTN